VDYDKWKMVSFPADLNNMAVYTLLRDDLGSYDRTKWRLYEYQANQYVEYGASGPVNHLGHAYWLRQRVGQSTTVDVDSAGTVVPSGATVDVPFASGWVDVGDPFLFPVKWSDIYAATGADTALIQGIYTYSGSAWTFPVTGSMAPWEGYSLKTSGAGTLRIPTIVATKAGADGPGWPQGWIGKITVVTGEGSDDNYFGIGEGTSAAADKYDYPEPPSGLTGVSGYFALGQGEYGSDIRPALGAGQTWEFAAQSRSLDNAITVQLPENLPKDVTVWLADLTDQVSQQMANGATYAYHAAASEKRCFKLIVGNGAYAAAELERAFLPPAVTLLAQNRPNPMADKTTINYQLAAGGKVELAVYNIVGQKVRTLVNGVQKAGKYRVAWDGGNDRGTRLSNGVYFYRLTASDAVQTKKLTIVR
ncbi:MAG TPA: FlgD immunoglobulin-like domain containing protein, partial [Candidatus Edwardsbacteria bacterium]|nr:FlgD immunoglobulin-like domain containing protein [Candidatus Edwardsbacteria bacterium]